MFWKLALRDLVLLAISVALWNIDAMLRTQGGFAALAVAIITALATVLVGFTAHEWGHLIGARWLHSVVYAPRTLRSVFLFYFDGEKNNRRQFVGMSWGGWIASLIFIAVLVLCLPLHALAAKLTLVIAGIGVIATAITEVPDAWRVHRGAPLPQGPVRE